MLENLMDNTCKRYLTDDDLYKVGERAIAAEGAYWGRHFVILSTGRGFPTAYISLRDDDLLLQKWDYEMLTAVHGEGTYLGVPYWEKDEEVKRTAKYVGWDYAHAGDYRCWSGATQYDLNSHKWTIDEILMDCVSGAIQLDDMQRHPDEYPSPREEWEMDTASTDDPD